MKKDLERFEDLETLSYYVNRHSDKYTKDDLIELIVSLIDILPYNLTSTNNYADDGNDARVIMNDLRIVYGDNFEESEEE